MNEDYLWFHLYLSYHYHWCCSCYCYVTCSWDPPAGMTFSVLHSSTHQLVNKEYVWFYFFLSSPPFPHCVTYSWDFAAGVTFSIQVVDKEYLRFNFFLALPVVVLMLLMCYLHLEHPCWSGYWLLLRLCRRVQSALVSASVCSCRGDLCLWYHGVQPALSPALTCPCPQCCHHYCVVILSIFVAVWISSATSVTDGTILVIVVSNNFNFEEWL